MSDATAATYLAFDIGATSGRAILGVDRGGGVIELEEVHRFPNGPVTGTDGVFWDIEGLFESMLEGMRRVAARGVAPRAIGIDTWGVDFALLDGSGQLLKRPRAYRDPRIAGTSRRVVERIGAQRLQDRTGSMHQDHASLCQYLLLAEREPQLLAKAERMLFIPDLLRYWLCGCRKTDVTFASTAQMYDVPGRRWATDIIHELGLPTDILPEVQIGPAVAGVLSETVREKTGLGETPVVIGAGHDTGAAFGICRGGDLPPVENLAVISSGTWSILGVFVDGHLPSGTLDPTRFGYEANPDGSLRIVSNLTGGWLIEQCRNVWRGQAVDCSYEALIASARQAAGTARASAILATGWEGFMRPDDMTVAITQYCADTGQPAPTTPGEFTQVIFASLADSYARGIEELRVRTGRALDNLYLIGGMSRNEYLNRLTADRAGVNVIVGPAEATAMGNVAAQIEATSSV